MRDTKFSRSTAVNGQGFKLGTGTVLNLGDVDLKFIGTAVVNC